MSAGLEGIPIHSLLLSDKGSTDLGGLIEGTIPDDQ